MAAALVIRITVCGPGKQPFNLMAECPVVIKCWFIGSELNFGGRNSKTRWGGERFAC